MEKILTLCVTHYKEPWEVCKPFFLSVADQMAIDFNDIEVVVVQDGNEGGISRQCLDFYPYEVRYIAIPHGGVSKARNKALRSANGKYVMFCDIDDRFSSCWGIKYIMESISEGFDVLNCSFVEEAKDHDGVSHPLRHEHDVTFIHGKVYEKKFLEENNLCFDEELTIHEDGYFNYLAHVCAKNEKTFSIPFYTWVYREGSVCRQPYFKMRTAKDFVMVRDRIICQLLERGHKAEAIENIVCTIMDMYYSYNHPDWTKKENVNFVPKNMGAFKIFYDKYGKYFDKTPTDTILQQAQRSRQRAYTDGMAMERITFRDFIKLLKV